MSSNQALNKIATMLLKAGKRYSGKYLIFCYKIADSKCQNTIIIRINRKVAKAVQRNKMKRQLRFLCRKLYCNVTLMIRVTKACSVLAECFHCFEQDFSRFIQAFNNVKRESDENHV